MTKNDTIIFEHEDSWESEGSYGDTYQSYENLYIYTKKNQKGYGYKYEVPLSEVTMDPNIDEEFIKDVKWDYFYRMHLTTCMRDLLGSFNPEEL